MKPTQASIDPVTDKRFELIRPLGEGASGAVFLARDRESGEQVALKKLFKLDLKSVQRFKREFRSLADITHPNLVKLYDLHRGQEAWFITMEYVSGHDFRQHFGAEPSWAIGGSDDRPKSPMGAAAANTNAHSQASLLRIFHDLACGVHAIHRAGMLHRDLKPSNALIADDGRVVVLDFGLVREIEDETLLTQEGTIAGTPAYMPPEQAVAGKLSEASDWYAFGVMLYEAISGVLPIDGRNATALMQRKLSHDPAPLRSGAPQAVLDLCMELLDRTPEQRPSGERILEVLAAHSGSARELTTTQEQALTIEPVATAVSIPLFGRDHELSQLREASEDAERSGSLVVHVRGTSGSGKSSLVEQFLDEAAHGGLTPPLVLRSRCYEREAMPFKALDGVVDGLVSHLSQLDDISCAHLLPTDIGDLARVFPVFERLSAVQRLRATARPRGDETQIRRRAESALRALITTIAGQLRLLLWIDDMQWGDLDSASVLRSWLEQPLAASVFIVLSYRSEEIQTSQALALLLQRPEQTDRTTQLMIDLAPLRPTDVRTLCMHRLAQRSLAPVAMVERIVSEARGNPFLAQQLTAIAEAKLARNDSTLDGLTMEALVERASAFLDDAARSLLNVLAIAGRPLSAQLALSTAGVFSAGRAHIHTLRSLRLLRTRDVAGERWLEVYHDRVREAVQATLSKQESQHVYASLLRALATQARDDHDFLHTLALGAGQRAQAFRHGLLAAERASLTLAFERAAELYSKCLELFDGQLELYQLWMKLAAAQSHCRRGFEAAKAYSSAAEHAPEDKRAELLQLAASHLVRSGRFEEGERMVQLVLQTHNMPVPKTSAGLLAAVGWEYARIALRRLDVPQERDTSKAPAETLSIALLYGTLSVETQLYAPLRSALFQARALRMTLDYGDSDHVARALCLSAALACVSGTQRAARRSHALLGHAERLFQRRHNQDIQLELLAARAVCAMFLGRPEEALPPTLEVSRMIESKSWGGAHGDYYYMFTVQMVRASALQSLGRLTEARQVLHEHVTRARATDNRAAILQVTINRTVDEQALDMCAGSRARLDEEHAELPKASSGILSAAHVVAVMRAGAATSDFEWAERRMRELWEPYKRSLVHRSAFLAMLAHTTHARLLLNQHFFAGKTSDPAALVADDLAQVASLPAYWINDVAIVRTRSRIATLRGDYQEAIRLLRPSLEKFEQTALKQEIMHDRYTLGLLLGGDEGQRLISAAHAGLLECGISDPVANMRAYVPELMTGSASSSRAPK